MMTTPPGEERYSGSRAVDVVADNAEAILLSSSRRLGFTDRNPPPSFLWRPKRFCEQPRQPPLLRCTATFPPMLVCIRQERSAHLFLR